jgi:hypothetical protein
MGAGVQLASELVASLPSALRQQFVLVACGTGAAPPGTVSLQAALADPSSQQLGRCLLIVNPSTPQLPDCQRLLAAYAGPAAVLLNAGWAGAGEAAALSDGAVKERLKSEVDQAIGLGVFGSPTFLIDDEPFFGCDKFDQMQRWLTRGGW